MYANAEGMPNGLMVYWKEVPKAAVYRVRLFIQDRHRKKSPETGREVEDEGEFIEIAVVDEPRNIRYHSFTGLATIDERIVLNSGGRTCVKTGRDYFVRVEAEDRSGAIVGKSEMMRVRLDSLTGLTHY